MAELQTFTLPVGTALSGENIGATLRADAVVVCHPRDEYLIRAALKLPATTTTSSAAQLLKAVECSSLRDREEFCGIHMQSGVAASAFQPDSSGSSLEHRLDSFAEAGLANVVSSLMDAWIAGPNAVIARAITSQRKEAPPDLDQRVFAALIEGLLQIQVFFLHLGQIRLELQKGGVVSEQSLLSLEQLLHEGSRFFVDERAVSCSTHPLGNVAGCGD
ncbi:hypothetical protein [Comamonas aquatica]|uniref:hypothetical protein n=1 Tax=Comamonas aquatica TaxID=225991 RepID=UPI0034D74F24